LKDKFKIGQNDPKEETIGGKELQKMTNTKQQQLEQKLETYRYLFAHGNESPTERQVECWMNYVNNGLKDYQPEKELSVEERAKQKIDILQNVGLYHRADSLRKIVLARAREKQPPEKPLEGIEKYIKQMEIRAREYTPDAHSHYNEERTILSVLVHDYITNHNPQVLNAAKNLRRFSSFRGFVGEDFPDVLFDIEQLAHLGINNKPYGIKVSKEGYHQALKNIRRTSFERQKERKTFDRVMFTDDPVLGGWSDFSYLVAQIKAEIPYNVLFIGYVAHPSFLIKDRKDVQSVLGGGLINIEKATVSTRFLRRDPNPNVYDTSGLRYYSPTNILRQYYGDTKKIEGGRWS